MYVWKLWRDSRSRWVICTTLGLTWLGMTLYLATGFKHIAPAPTGPGFARFVANLYGPVVFMAILTALLLSEASLGMDFAKNTAEALLTRPRPRRYFAWTGWLFGMAQILALMYLMVGCFLAVLAGLAGTGPNWRLLTMPILLLPAVGMLFGVGYLVGVLGNGKYGAVAGLGVIVAYYSGVTLVMGHWNIHYPPRWWFDALSSWARPGSPGAFPILPLLGWMLVALLFPLLAQWSLERKQI